MDASMWIAKTGLDAQQMRMSVISNNLANVNTSGFKRDRANFEDMLYQNLRQPGGQTSANSQAGHRGSDCVDRKNAQPRQHGDHQKRTGCGNSR